MIQLRVERIIGCPRWYVRRCIAWRIDDNGNLRHGPRRITRRGAERAYFRRGEVPA